MHNDFIIVGPPSDPAGIRGTTPSTAAFRKIAGKGALFLSRGDKSGTHSKELGLWKASGAAYEGKPWYQQTGLGMGQTLSVAAEKKGYTLADRGTYLAMKKSLGLDVLVEGDKDLLNVYHVIVVNPAKWPKVNAEGANAFAGFLVAADTQKAIGTFGVGKFGAPLFFPDAGKKVEELGR
jgi:tungstate transport system substrate-binding protein